MRRFNIMLVIVTSLVTITVIAMPASANQQAQQDHGKRVTPPVCIGIDSLAPINATTVFGQHVTVPRAGQLRSVARKEKCRTDEVRGLGVVVPDNDAGSGAPGPPGPKGATGAAGAKGATGAAGANGVNGTNGKDSTVPGHAGPAGAQGPPGAQGAPGAPGAGVGDGTRWLCEDGNTGHGMADGGTGAQPDCNGGTKLAFKVVTVGSPIVYK